MAGNGGCLQTGCGGLLVVLAGLALLAYAGDHSGSGTGGGPEAKAPPVPMGQVFHATGDGWDFSVAHVEESAVGADAADLQVAVHAVNTANGAHSIGPDRFKLHDANGRTWENTQNSAFSFVQMLAAAYGQSVGKIEPGLSADVGLDFHIPQSATGLSLETIGGGRLAVAVVSAAPSGSPSTTGSAPPSPTHTFSAGQYVSADTQGDCLLLRNEPSLASAGSVPCVRDGTPLRVLRGPTADNSGAWLWDVATADSQQGANASGWARDLFLAPAAAPPAPAVPPAVSAASNTGPPQPPNAGQAGCASQTYTVQAGDTVPAMAQRLGVTTAALAAANNQSDPNGLQIGQQLRAPPSASAVAGC